MSAHICPVVKLSEPKPIEGADKIEVFEIAGSGPLVCLKGQFRAGDLACFVPPETMVNTARSDFDFLKKHARKSDGWAKVKPIRLRGQLSIGLLLPAPGSIEGDNLADFYQVKKIEDFEVVRVEKHNEGKKIGFWRRLWLRFSGRSADTQQRGLWPGIPVYDINQLYKMRSNLFAPDELMVVTEKLHGTNARYTIGRDGKLWCGSRTMWRVHDGKNVYSRAAVESGLEAKLRRLAEPLVLWGEIIGPEIQKGFSYGLAAGQQKFYAFDIYHAGERRFLDPCETKDICHWLAIDTVPIVSISNWADVAPTLMTCTGVGPLIGTNIHDHPQEGIVVRPWKAVKESHALDGSRCLLAGKVINPAYLEFREKPGMDEQIFL